MNLKCLGCGAVNSHALYDNKGVVCIRCKQNKFETYNGVVKKGNKYEVHGQEVKYNPKPNTDKWKILDPRPKDYLAWVHALFTPEVSGRISIGIFHQCKTFDDYLTRNYMHTRDEFEEYFLKG